MSLITNLRCRDFEDIIGNEKTKYILQEIIKEPNNKPRNIIFAGNYGNNKTSFARIFASKLNNDNPDVDIEQIFSPLGEFSFPPAEKSPKQTLPTHRQKPNTPSKMPLNLILNMGGPKSPPT